MPPRPLRYGFATWLVDRHWGRSHGKNNLPLIHGPVDEEGDDWLLTYDGPRPTTPHLDRINSASNEQLALVYADLVRETARPEAELRQAEAGLDVPRARMQELLKEQNEPDDPPNLAARRAVEIDLCDLLVSDRRRGEQARHRDRLRNRYLRAAGDATRAEQEILRLRELLWGRNKFSAATARRIHHYHCRRTALYWAHVTRHHRYGPQLSHLLESVGPQLPEWVLDIEARQQGEDNP